MQVTSTLLDDKMPLQSRLGSLIGMRVRTRRWQSSYQPPDPPSTTTNPHREFYKQFGRPVAKNFLIALCTYQLLYWSWLKLESLEFKKDKQDEIHAVETELRSLAKTDNKS